MKILVLRNDRLGDLALALPAFEVLARGLPGAELLAFVPEYTREVAELCPFVDRVLVDPGGQDPRGAARALARRWRELELDGMLALLSKPRTALAGFLARVPVRVAPATKAFQWLHNERVVQRRRRSVQPEYAYNVDLARHLVGRLGGAHPDCEGEGFGRPLLAPDPELVRERRAELRAMLGLREGQHLIAVHPGHGGSSTNLTLQQYARLLRAIASGEGHAFLITAAPAEVGTARELAALLEGRARAVHESREGLRAFSHVLAAADVVIGSSTGPLQLAGALDLRTAGFYVRRASSSSLRWRTLSRDGRRLAFEPPPGAGERELDALDLDAAAAEISARFLSGAEQPSPARGAP